MSVSRTNNDVSRYRSTGWPRADLSGIALPGTAAHRGVVWSFTGPTLPRHPSARRLAAQRGTPTVVGHERATERQRVGLSGRGHAATAGLGFPLVRPIHLLGW